MNEAVSRPGTSARLSRGLKVVNLGWLLPLAVVLFIVQLVVYCATCPALRRVQPAASRT